MTKEKNIKYLKTYRRALKADIANVERKITRLDMKLVKFKEDLKDIREIIQDLETPIEE